MKRHAPLVFLAFGLVALAVWRAACVLAGPDIDTDAYAHHMIARAILENPRDLAVHWVWLPLFHYAQVPLIALGGTMEHVRWANTVLAAVLPVAVFAYVRRTTTRGASQTSPDVTAMFAALIAAACPIAMQMGTTAQPEPVFALLIFCVAVAFQENRYGWVAATLAAGVLLRYEAWACLVVVAAVLAADWRLPERRHGHAWIAVIVPASAIALWAVLRRPVDGQWFGFLGQTREFATGAVHEKSALDRGLSGLLGDLLYYPLFVPFRVMGPVLPLAAFGVARTVRQQGSRFVLVLASCLGFVSLTWVLRSSLGLDRHFVVVVPLYAIFAAQGAAAIADATARRLARSSRKWKDAESGATAGRALGGLLSVASLAGLLAVLSLWMGFWRGSLERGFPDREATGNYLRSLPGSPTIYCDDATVEILSRIDRHRFDRHWLDDPHTWDLVAETARERGVAYVATWRRKLVGHEHAGTTTFQAGAVEGDAATGLGVMRVGPGALGARP
jgi:hypothetical protein